MLKIRVFTRKSTIALDVEKNLRNVSFTLYSEIEIIKSLFFLVFGTMLITVSASLSLKNGAKWVCCHIFHVIGFKETDISCNDEHCCTKQRPNHSDGVVNKHIISMFVVFPLKLWMNTWFFTRWLISKAGKQRRSVYCISWFDFYVLYFSICCLCNECRRCRSAYRGLTIKLFFSQYEFDEVVKNNRKGLLQSKWNCLHWCQPWT